MWPINLGTSGYRGGMERDTKLLFVACFVCLEVGYIDKGTLDMIPYYEYTTINYQENIGWKVSCQEGGWG